MTNETITPRIPRGWARVTYRGKDLWRNRLGKWIETSSTGAIDPDVTYIRRTDPNEALRLEDETALQALSDEIAKSPFSLAEVIAVMRHARALGVSGSVDTTAALAALAAEFDKREPDHSPDAGGMVPGMMPRHGAWRELPRAVVVDGRVAGVTQLAELRERARMRDVATELPDEGEWVLGATDLGSRSMVVVRWDTRHPVRPPRWVDPDKREERIRGWWPLPEVTDDK